jgi:hypothetical protein
MEESNLSLFERSPCWYMLLGSCLNSCTSASLDVFSLVTKRHFLFTIPALVSRKNPLFISAVTFSGHSVAVLHLFSIMTQPVAHPFCGAFTALCGLSDLGFPSRCDDGFLFTLGISSATVWVQEAFLSNPIRLSNQLITEGSVPQLIISEVFMVHCWRKEAPPRHKYPLTAHGRGTRQSLHRKESISQNSNPENLQTSSGHFIS